VSGLKSVVARGFNPFPPAGSIYNTYIPIYIHRERERERARRPTISTNKTEYICTRVCIYNIIIFRVCVYVSRYPIVNDGLGIPLNNVDATRPKHIIYILYRVYIIICHLLRRHSHIHIYEYAPKRYSNYI